MEEAVFDAFAAEVSTKGAAALPRFLALLCQGLDEPRPVLKILRERLETRPAPDPHALAAGLEWLRELDARPALSRLNCPLLLIGGERDALLPYAALETLAELNPSFRLARIDGASHVPFLSHEEETLASLRPFLDECAGGP
jgi:pimeloyl-[acyl-carrier protein] methyl ester esterase